MVSSNVSNTAPARNLKNRTQSSDYAVYIFGALVVCQILFLVSSWKALGLSKATPVFLGAQFILPVFVVLFARTWRSVLHYGLASTLVVPLGMSLLLAVVAVLKFIKSRDLKGVLSSIGMTMSVTGTTWLVMLAVLLPTMLIAAGIRYVWLRVRSRFIFP